jgi:hypothetical protein
MGLIQTKFHLDGNSIMILYLNVNESCQYFILLFYTYFEEVKPVLWKGFVCQLTLAWEVVMGDYIYDGLAAQKP